MYSIFMKTAYQKYLDVNASTVTTFSILRRALTKSYETADPSFTLKFKLKISNLLGDHLHVYRRIYQGCSMKKLILKNFAKFTGKHLFQGLFSNRMEDLRSVTLLKKRLCHSCFPANFAKFLRTRFFKEHLWTTASVCRAARYVG